MADITKLRELSTQIEESSGHLDVSALHIRQFGSIIESIFTAVVLNSEALKLLIPNMFELKSTVAENERLQIQGDAELGHRISQLAHTRIEPLERKCATFNDDDTPIMEVIRQQTDKMDKALEHMEEWQKRLKTAAKSFIVMDELVSRVTKLEEQTELAANETKSQFERTNLDLRELMRDSAHQMRTGSELMEMNLLRTQQTVEEMVKDKMKRDRAEMEMLFKMAHNDIEKRVIHTQSELKFAFNRVRENEEQIRQFEANSTDVSNLQKAVEESNQKVQHKIKQVEHVIGDLVHKVAANEEMIIDTKSLAQEVEENDKKLKEMITAKADITSVEQQLHKAFEDIMNQMQTLNLQLDAEPTPSNTARRRSLRPDSIPNSPVLRLRTPRSSAQGQQNPDMTITLTTANGSQRVKTPNTNRSVVLAGTVSSTAHGKNASSKSGGEKKYSEETEPSDVENTNYNTHNANTRTNEKPKSPFYDGFSTASEDEILSEYANSAIHSTEGRAGSESDSSQQHLSRGHGSKRMKRVRYMNRHGQSVIYEVEANQEVENLQTFSRNALSHAMAKVDDPTTVDYWLESLRTVLDTKMNKAQDAMVGMLPSKADRRDLRAKVARLKQMMNDKLQTEVRDAMHQLGLIRAATKTLTLPYRIHDSQSSSYLSKFAVSSTDDSSTKGGGFNMNRRTISRGRDLSASTPNLPTLVGASDSVKVDGRTLESRQSLDATHWGGFGQRVGTSHSMYRSISTPMSDEDGPLLLGSYLQDDTDNETVSASDTARNSRTAPASASRKKQSDWSPMDKSEKSDKAKSLVQTIINIPRPAVEPGSIPELDRSPYRSKSTDTSKIKRSKFDSFSNYISHVQSKKLPEPVFPIKKHFKKKEKETSENPPDSFLPHMDLTVDSRTITGTKRPNTSSMKSAVPAQSPKENKKTVESDMSELKRWNSGET
eukprot:GILJ01007061.1.p1 GENE.GILJ01007061.1~~GILJ01007061.1.p1  ORF type:complete len:959 (+),score=190.09 GILJ01007061.1:56-2878(+)